jgi:hypothetical protein
VNGGRVELEVARVEQRARRRADHQADGVGDAVVDGDRLHVERPEPGVLAFANGVLGHPPQLAVLLELDRDQAEGQRRAVDRDRVVRVELHDQIRQPADVILVAVREDDAEQPVHVLGDVGVVAHDQVHPVELGLGELDARVDDDHVFAELDQS